MNTEEIIQLSDANIMHTYGRIPLALTKGQGSRVWDAEGREYLDLVSGIAVCSLGHCHPAVVKAIREQAGQLMHCSNLYYIENQAKLAHKLTENCFADRVFFCNSGAEANEAAIKLARKYAKLNLGTAKFEIITALHSFHGRTLAAITATGQPKYQKYFDPLPAGFKYVPYNDLSALKESVTENTCAILLEPIQGEGGVYPAEPEYLKGVRQLCDEQNLVLIFDEVQCGLGRSGHLFAHQGYGVVPDILTLAKALGGGFPMGAMLASSKVAASFQPGDHASTFGGTPLACAAGLAVMQELTESNILEQVKINGAFLQDGLLKLQARFPKLVTDVRGKGLMLGMELNQPVKEIVTECQNKGLLILNAGPQVLRFLPPLNITQADLTKALNILEQVLNEKGGF